MKYAALALLALAAPATAQAQARTDRTVLMSEDPNGRKVQDEWGFSDAVIAGDLVFLSGVVVGLPPGSTDLEAAYDRVYKRVEVTLKRAGVGWDDIVDITSFHTDVTAQLDAMVAVQKRYIKAPPPAWTAIDVDRLVPEGGITEIKFVAKRSR